MDALETNKTNSYLTRSQKNEKISQPLKHRLHQEPPFHRPQIVRICITLKNTYTPSILQENAQKPTLSQLSRLSRDN